MIRTFQGGSAPAITKSCTTPGLALSTTTTKPHHEMEWSVTGPPNMRYLVMVGVSGFVSSAGGLVATPDAGHTKEQMQPGSQRQTMDGDCVQNGRFGVLVPPGTYHVGVFRLERQGGQIQAVDVADQTLVVNRS